MRDGFGRVDTLVPKVNRVVFDGHDKIQDMAVGDMHDTLKRVAGHVETITDRVDRTQYTLDNIAKAMKAVKDNTVELHTIHTGPSPMKSGITDPETALTKIGDVADQRPVPKDAGVSRIGAQA